MTEAAVPIRNAATVILVRDGTAGLETLLVRRSAELVFHGGSWVFPGGRVDEGDHAGGRSVEEAARVAAVREAQEESGLVLDRDVLVPFSHWTTPPGRPRRFATWFFLGAAPIGDITTDGSEITEHAWFTPADALEAQRVKEIELPPPTFVSLRWLAESTTVDDALTAAAARPYIRFEPRIHAADGGYLSIYPGDVAYDDPARIDDLEPRHRLWSVEAGWRYERTGA